MHLIGLTDYKQYKGITNPDQDTQLAFVIESVSAFVKKYCGRSFVEYITTSKVEYFDSNTDLVYLSEIPLQNVVSVKYSTDGGVVQIALVENADYFVSLADDSVVANGTCFYPSTIKHKSLEVTYTGGYIVLPDDLKLAVIEYVDYYKNEEYTPRQSMGANSKDNTFIIPSAIPHYIKNIFDLYRSI